METMLGTEMSETSRSLPTFQKVLLCTDFSERSQAAQNVAIRLCQGRDMQLTVMHVSEYGPMPAVTDESLDYVLGLTAKEHRALQELTVQLRNQGIQVEPVMAEGNAASMILEGIRRRDIDLAIIGTEASRGFNRFVFGSTAEASFARSVSCSYSAADIVLTFHRKSTEDQLFSLPTSTTAPCMRCVMQRALQKINRSPLHIVHVLPLTADGGETATLIMREALRHLAVSLPADGTVPHCEVVFGRDVSHAIVEYAMEQDADFIAMPKLRRKSTLAAHLPPHRIFRIVMTTTCPVLTVACEPESALHLAAGL